MKLSDNGINILKELEGVIKNGDKHIIYDDKMGKPVPANTPLPPGATIGYGHLIKTGEDFTDGISESTATHLLRTDVAVAERAVRDNITRPLHQNQFDALVIFAFNIGTNNFKNSTVVKYINNPQFHSAIYPDLESAWMAWNKSGGRVMCGLAHRRRAEWKLFCAI